MFQEFIRNYSPVTSADYFDKTTTNVKDKNIDVLLIMWMLFESKHTLQLNGVIINS